MGNEERLAVPQTAERMAGAASAFLGALTAGQQERACYAFGSDDVRREWSFLPAPDRDGLPIGALGEEQRRLAHELILTGTSMPAYTKVVSVMAMEHVLRALAPERAGLYDPERYCFKVFARRATRHGAGSSPGIMLSRAGPLRRVRPPSPPE